MASETNKADEAKENNTDAAPVAKSPARTTRTAKTEKAPKAAKAVKAVKVETAADKPKRSIKNPWLYAGTVVILAITIVAFVVAPALGGSSSGSVPQFGSWNGKPITYASGSYFANQVAQINEYLRQQGLTEANFQYYAYQVWRLAFESTAVRTAVLDSVADSGFRVSSKGIDTAIAANASFQEDGQFSADKYRAASLASQLSIRDTTRDDLMVTRYYEDVYTLAPSTAETEFVAQMGKPRRTISYVAFSLEAYTNEDLLAWANENTDLFRKVGLSRITVTSSLADAQKILKQIRDNSLSFEDAAKSHSQDSYADKGGDAGTVYFHLFVSDFTDKAEAEKIASLKKGELSDVIKTGDKVWTIYRVNSELAAPDFTQADTLAEVKDYLYTTERGKIEGWAIAKANDFAGKAMTDGFDASAKKAGMATKKAGPFLINTGNPSFSAYGQSVPLFDSPDTTNAPELVSASSDEAFLTEAFSVAKNKPSRPLVLGDNVIVFQVTDNTDAAEDQLGLAKFAYPYFQQQTVDASIRDSFLASKKFVDKFQDTFFKVFQSSSTTSTSESSTTTTVQKAG
ncbi:MAG: SurA N-terminal domain-containing protein [Rectinemataceae bacterium]